MNTFSLDPLDLAALLCSRVCHDVISPVGAIVNGLEMLEDEKDADMRSFAMDLIKKSAETASAKLQFCRLAFGGAASTGAAIDTGDAEKVARGTITRMASHVRGLLEGNPEHGSVDAHGIQAYYTGLVARSVGMKLDMTVEAEMVALEAMSDAKDEGAEMVEQAA